MSELAVPTPDQRAVDEWTRAVQDADQVLGHSLIGGKDNEKTLDLLVGVPFVIENVTFRRGDVNIAPKGTSPHYRDYVSVEALVHPLYQSKFPRERVVFNDGSTGIYRQIVAYLTGKGLVTVDETKPEKAPSNESRYDVSFSTANPDGTYTAPYVAIKIVCPEGLRKSDYSNEYGDAETWYLA